jgi:hypothetical protein
MGGLIALKMGEDPRFAPLLAGVYAVCPPADGLLAWDSGFDLRMVYDAVCAGVGGGELLTGSPPLDWALDLVDVPNTIDITSRSDPALRTAARVAQCTGLILPAFLRTPPQRDRLRLIQSLSGISDEDFLLTNLGYAVFGLSELLRAPDKLAGANPFGNTDTRYALALPSADQAASTIDARVRRVDADPFARVQLAHSSVVEGTANVPIVSLHTSGDQLVPAWHQRQLHDWYADDPGRLLQAIVVEPSPSHCGFESGELQAGWDALRGWLATGAKPTVAALQQRCIAAPQGGACRIDAAASQTQQLPQPPRLRTTADSRFARSGFWFDPRRGGEGIVVTELDDSMNAREDAKRRRVAISWYTYAPGADGGGAQRWITGAGVAHGNALVIDDAVLVFDGRLGASTPVRRQRFGRIELVFDADAGVAGPQASTARLRYSGPAGWGSGELSLVRLTWSGAGLTESAQAAAQPPIDTRASARSGIYFDPAREGQGFFLQQQLATGGATARSFLAMFTFDAAGRPLWLVGADTGNGNGRIVFDPVQSTRGARFDAFDPGQVQRLPWGRIELEYRDCDISAVNWQANDPQIGSGRMQVQRLVPRRGVVTGCTPG